MSKYLIVLFFFLSVISKGISQSSMSDYSFVIVPERFNFLNEVDKYQLNSIADRWPLYPIKHYKAKYIDEMQKF